MSRSMRASLHVGRPRCIGGDYLGLDVTIAARLAEEAGADELLVSEAALDQADSDSLDVGKERKLQVKGVPDLKAYSLRL